MKLFHNRVKWISIFVLVAVVASSVIVAINVLNPGEIEACRDQGCSPNFWRDNPGAWLGHAADEAVNTVFSGADIYDVGNTTLYNVLKFRWNFSTSDPVAIEARSLLREAVTACLNVSHPDIDYHYAGTMVTSMVNDALASGDTLKMHTLTKLLLRYNNAICPLPPIVP